MTLKVTTHPNFFWLQRFQEQVAIVYKKRAREPDERLLALDLALGYLFLYLFLEATVDKIVWNLCSFQQEGGELFRRYKQSRRYLRDKLEFVFTEFCSQLPFEAFATLKRKVQPLGDIRNGVIHLEELSWTGSGDGGPVNEPTRFTQHLTLERFKHHYETVMEFLADLKVVLNRAFDNANVEINVEGVPQSFNKADYIYRWSLPSSWLKSFEEMAESVSRSVDESAEVLRKHVAEVS
jgi:hypothetical protein